MVAKEDIEYVAKLAKLKLTDKLTLSKVGILEDTLPGVTCILSK